MNRKGQFLDLNFLWLIVGCICLLFMGGKWNILIATWVGSIFFVRFFRTQRSPWAILLALPFVLIASHVFFLGLAVQVTVGFQILIAVSYTLYVMVPCLVDRLLYRKLGNPLLSTLLYPASLVVVQWLLSYIEALGTVLNWTGFLFSMKPLIQIVSITGVWGPSFLVGWLASIVNTLWENGFDLNKVKLPVAVFGGVFIASMLWGGIRMVFFAPGPGTVKDGCSMLRTTLEGLTMGIDFQGRVLSQMNYYVTSDNRTIITELPTRGVWTLYSRWGDWFAYGCVMLTILLMGITCSSPHPGGGPVPAQWNDTTEQ